MRRSILVVAPCLPLPADFGGAIRTFYLVRELAREHDVMLVAPSRGGEHRYVRQLGAFCDVTAVPARSTMRHRPHVLKQVSQLRSVASRRSFLEQSSYNARLQQVIARLFLTRGVDLVQYEFTQMALHALPRPCPTIIDAHNIEHKLIERVAGGSHAATMSMLKRLEARKVRRLEHRLWASVHACVAASAHDAATIAVHSSLPPVLVPNGVDVAAYSPPEGNVRRPHHIVFTGVLRHQPNVDGILWYLQHVHPLVTSSIPDASVTIAGADPPSSIARFASPSVAVTGHVADVRPFLFEASAAIVPLFAGSGTRLKIVEAFAAGVPVVSTTVGAEGIAVQDGVELVIADDPRSFANGIVTLLTDPHAAQSLMSAARRRAAQDYDWAVVVQPLLAAHEAAIQAAG